MKVLLTHRFFWPDTPPYATLLRAIGDQLAQQGHRVHVFASIPSYRADGNAAPRREQLGALSIRRVGVLRNEKSAAWRRGANVLIYCAALFLHILRTRPDVVTASTFPPVLAGWSASLAARICGARFVYHLQDIHPEVSQISGAAFGRGAIYRLLRLLDNQTLRRASAIVTLSPDMAKTLSNRGLGPLPIRIINNLALDQFGENRAAPEHLLKPAGVCRVIFAGNLGRFQNLSKLADGIARLFETNPQIELFFLGDGAAQHDLKSRWGKHPQVKFAPFLPFDQARDLIAGADVGLVSLERGIYRVAYPSKLLTYLGLGVPVLALVEPESHLARDLVASSVGVVPDTDHPERIAQALARLIAARPERRTVLKAHDRLANRDEILATWCHLIASLDTGAGLHPAPETS
ncbi:glycosyltransferase family 4 protein [Maritimibacter dapengensis]|uniref:Glycosyltransferase family 4 protein n=1 Tax=Maritimibacter dapengensis TaxID=2836868 RepID=A0ABS6T4K6_9RHOB|nr:glycosyltransferase family 4 protein [Maritimibacter dapengensis]MBV7380164.1 glycosyltransferase family 4 protein [Maritimibacter dapengensis]